MLTGGAARCGRCQTYREQRATVPARRTRLNTAVLASTGELFATHPEAGLLFVDRNGMEPIDGCPEAPAYAHIVRFSDDHYYVSTERGAIHELTISPRGCAVIARRTTTATRAIRWLDTAPDGSEVVAIDLGGQVHIGRRQGPLAHRRRAHRHGRRHEPPRTGRVARREPLARL